MDGTSSSYGASSGSQANGSSNTDSGNKSGKTSSGASSSSAAKTQTRQGSSSSPTQARSATEAKGNGTDKTSPKAGGQSFIQTLAQSQADAEDSATAAATAAPEEILGGKSKAAKDEESDSALALLSPSLAAAMAAIQPANQTAAAFAAAQDGSVDGVSLQGGALKGALSNLAQGTATELKADADADDSKADTTNNASSVDNTSAANAVAAANVGTTSHLQQLESESKINSTVGTASFNDELGGKITWMASQGVQSASLQLSPEHLGPVDVRISVQDGSASVMFTASHADTRAALEQALPRLREMFASQGLALADAGVSQQSPRGQSQRQAVTAIGAVGGSSNDDTATTVTAVTSVAPSRPGLLDLYA